MSLRRQNPWMTANISAKALFFAGMATLPAFLIQDSLVIRVAQVVLFGWLTVVAGKRLLWVYFLTISVGITFFHLLIPTGEVLMEIGKFPITAGALKSGGFKALTIVGMVFLSLISVRADLRIPGRAGAVAGKLFWSFEQIMERRDELRASSPLRSADELLVGLYQSLRQMDDSVSDTQARKETAGRSSVAGVGVLTVLAGLQWALLFVRLP